MVRVYEKVRAYIDEMGYKQVTIAVKAGIPKATFNAILNGKRTLYAKAKGKTIGRPAVTADTIPAIFYKHYPKYKKGEINKAEFSRLCDLSYPTIYKYLRIVEQ